MSDDLLLLERVIELENKGEFLLAELNLRDWFEAVPPPVDADVAALAQQSKMIQAIQLYRQKHNANL
jgi:hypothetical protein